MSGPPRRFSDEHRRELQALGIPPEHVAGLEDAAFGEPAVPPLTRPDRTRGGARLQRRSPAGPDDAAELLRACRTLRRLLTSPGLLAAVTTAAPSEWGVGLFDRGDSPARRRFLELLDDLSDVAQRAEAALRDPEIVEMIHGPRSAARRRAFAALTLAYLMCGMRVTANEGGPAVRLVEIVLIEVGIEADARELVRAWRRDGYTETG